MKKIKYIWEWVNEVDNIHQTIHCTEEEFLEKFKHIGMPRNYHKLEWTKQIEGEEDKMKTIYKYVLRDKVCKIKTFAGGKILSVQKQGEDLCMWIQIDTDREDEDRIFHVIGTGHPIPESQIVEMKYIGTVQWDVATILHVFEATTKSE